MSTQSEILRFLLQGESKSLVDALNGANSSLKGTETAAERVALQMKAMATVIETEGRQSAAAAEALSAALGPEIVANVERAGGSIEGLVADLNRAGVAMDDIRAEANTLADGLRSLDTAGRSVGKSVRSGADEASDGVRRLGTESDQSRSVLANLVGNTSQDLGELGGVAGTAGVAIGQLAEYAVDGNIKLSNLAKVAGPLAAVTAAGLGISMAMDAAAKRAEEAARKAGVLRDIIEDLNSGDSDAAAEGLVTEYEKTLDILERFGFTAADLKLALEGSGHVVRGLADDMADLQARRDELLAKKASIGFLNEDETAQLDWILSQLTDIDAVTNTLANDSAKWEAESLWLEQHKNRLDAVNASLRLQGGYWGDIARAQSQAASVANDLADQDKAATTAANKISALREELRRYIAEVGNVPAEKVTEIEAALNAGNVALVERLLANLTRDRVARVSVVFGKPTQEIGKGAAVGSGAKGSRNSPDPQSVLKDLLDEADAATGGGGGGGGGGSGAAEDPQAEFDRAIGNLFDTGQTSLANYRQYLQGRIGAYATFSDEYRAIWSKLRELDKIEADAAKDAADAEKQRQDDEKKAAEELADTLKKAAEEQRKAAEQARQAADDQLDAVLKLVDLVDRTRRAEYGNLEGAVRDVGAVGSGARLNEQQFVGWLADLLRSFQESMT